MELYEASKFADIRVVSSLNSNSFKNISADLIDRSRTNYPYLWFTECPTNCDKSLKKRSEKVVLNKYCCAIENLPSTIDNENEILRILSTYGPIVNIEREVSKLNNFKIIIFVQFRNESDALKACEMLNGRKLFGNILKAKYEFKEEYKEVTIRNSKEIPSFVVDSLIEHESCSFVQICELTNQINSTDLLYLCQQYGQILKTEIFSDDNSTIPFGFVCFKNKGEAESFSIQFNDGLSLMNDHFSEIRLLDELKTLSNYVLNEVREKIIIIKNIKISVTERDLNDLFQPCGEIKTIFVDKTLFSIKCCDLTYALICFVDEESAKKALTTMMYWPLRDLPMDICSASMDLEFKKKYTPEQAEIRGELMYDWGPKRDELIKKRSRNRLIPSYVLYVGNLPEMEKMELKSLCQMFGLILNVKIKRNDSIYGLVKFQELQSVYKSVVHLNGFNHRGNVLVAQPAKQCVIAAKNLGYEVEEILQLYTKCLKKIKARDLKLSCDEEDYLISLCCQWSLLEISSSCCPLEKLFRRLDKIKTNF